MTVEAEATPAQAAMIAAWERGEAALAGATRFAELGPFHAAMQELYEHAVTVRAECADCQARRCETYHGRLAAWMLDAAERQAAENGARRSSRERWR